MGRIVFQNGWEARLIILPSETSVSFLRPDGKVVRNLPVDHDEMTDEVVDKVRKRLLAMSEIFKKGHNIWWLVRYADDIHEFTFVTLADSEEDACHNLGGYCGKRNRYDIDVLYVTPLTRAELARYGTSEAVKTDVESVLDNLKEENFAPAEFCI